LTPNVKKESLTNGIDKMKKNIGQIDRLVRLSIGIAFLGYAIWDKSWIAAAFALFTFYEAAASWCILYQILGKNSCPLDKK
jgi:hypothetical protein